MRLKDTKQEKKWSVALNELVLDDKIEMIVMY